MDRTLAADLARLPELLDATRAAAADALATLDARPVVPPAPPAPSAGPAHAPEGLPEHATGTDAALVAFRDRWEPRLSASAGPRYLGFVTGGATPAALAGDWLTAVHDQNSNSALDGGGQDLERETVGWLRDLFGLSTAHSGTFVSGATMSNTTGLAIAREWLGERLGVSPAEDGAAALGPVRVLSGAPHSSIGKALSVLGLGRNSLVRVPTLPGREAVDPAALERALADTPGPAVVVANAGTVNTVDFDDLRAIRALRERHEFWLHTDAAFGAFAALSRSTRTSSTAWTPPTPSASTCTNGSTSPTTAPSSSPAAAICRPGSSRTPPPTSAPSARTPTSSTSPPRTPTDCGPSPPGSRSARTVARATGRSSNVTSPAPAPWAPPWPRTPPSPSSPRSA